MEMRLPGHSFKMTWAEAARRAYEEHPDVYEKYLLQLSQAIKGKEHQDD